MERKITLTREEVHLVVADLFVHREHSRDKKDWKTADLCRSVLEKLGFNVVDDKDAGQLLIPKAFNDINRLT